MDLLSPGAKEYEEFIAWRRKKEPAQQQPCRETPDPSLEPRSSLLEAVPEVLESEGSVVVQVGEEEDDEDALTLSPAKKTSSRLCCWKKSGPVATVIQYIMFLPTLLLALPVFFFANLISLLHPFIFRGGVHGMAKRSTLPFYSLYRSLSSSACIFNAIELPQVALDPPKAKRIMKEFCEANGYVYGADVVFEVFAACPR